MAANPADIDTGCPDAAVTAQSEFVAPNWKPFVADVDEALLELEVSWAPNLKPPAELSVATEGTVELPNLKPLAEMSVD